MKIGEAIRKLRRVKDFTQDYVADKAGITSGHLSKIENGGTDPDSEMIIKIAEAMGTTATSIFAVMDEKKLAADLLKEPNAESLYNKAHLSQTEGGLSKEDVKLLDNLSNQLLQIAKQIDEIKNKK